MVKLGKIGKTTQILILCQIVCFLIRKWHMPNFYPQLLQEAGVVVHVQNMAMPHKVQLCSGSIIPKFLHPGKVSGTKNRPEKPSHIM